MRFGNGVLCTISGKTHELDFVWGVLFSRADLL